jgi:SAM-dependent methyltransferase
MMEETNHDWDSHYKTNNTPWVTGEPALELVEYFKELGKAPADALEIGSGVGTDSIWMAQQGSRVTAVDISPTALETAKKNAESAQAKVNFVLGDIRTERPVQANSVDFVYDRGVYHVMTAEQQPSFVDSVADVLRDGGTWLCIAGSADQKRDPAQMGPPQLTAVQLLGAVERRFEILRLARGFFHLPDGSRHLSWVALFGKRR